MPKIKSIKSMNDTELLRRINERLDNLILAISVSGKTFQEQVSYLNNLRFKPQKISEVIGRPRQSVKDMVKAVKGKRIEIEKDDATLRLGALLRFLTETSKDKQKYTKAIFYAKSVGIPNTEVAKIFGVNENSIPSYIKRYNEMKKSKKKSIKTENIETEQTNEKEQESDE
jgi:hypothetical protein